MEYRKDYDDIGLNQMEAVGTIPSLPRGCKPPVGGAAPDDAY